MVERKIKLAILTLSAGGVGGGLERMETLLFRRLDRDIFDPKIVVMNDPVPGEISYDELIPYEFTGSADRFGSLLKLIRDADIVTFNGGFDPLVCEAATVSGVPSLVEVMHNTDPGQAHGAIDLTICVSETVRAEQPYRDKTIVIPNGVELDKLPFDPAPLPRERIVILEAARRDKPARYHLDELAKELLALDPKIELWLAGRGQTGQAGETGKTGGRIRYFGLVREVEQLYGAADILLALSEKEALGLSAIEAMACGCVPVVAEDTGLGEVVSDGVNGFLVDATDKEQVTQTIRKALKMRDSEEWSRMRAAARLAVEQKFNIVRCAAEYGGALRKLVGAKGFRAGRGPEMASAPADALVADIYFLLSTGKTQLALDRVQDVLRAQIPIRHPKAAKLARTLADFFADQKIAGAGAGAADALYEALHNCGVRDEETLVRWADVRQGDTGFILDELETLDPNTREGVMLITERKLNQGKVGEAVRLLERLVDNSPDDAQSREALQALRSKLYGGA